MFSLGFAILIFMNIYVFIRGWQAVPAHFFPRILYMALYWLAAFSFFPSRYVETRFPPFLGKALTWIGSFWIVALIYFFLAVLFLDALRLANHIRPFFPAAVLRNYPRAKYVTAIVILGVVGAVVLGGHINSRIPRIRELEFSVDKKAGDLKKLDIVLLSDLHLGNIIGRSRLKKIVDKINALHPDVVLIPGDVVDRGVEPVIKENMGEEFERIQSVYGVFACAGNHEYFGSVEKASAYLNAHNVTVLRDSAVKVADAFYVIGREDRSAPRRGLARKGLKELMDGMETKLPVIVLDHQPYDLGDTAAVGADVQFSGHTHYGQFWPVNHIVKAIYEVAWGYKKIGNTHFYVTNGVGTWGPPVRVGNRPEIVHIRLNFQSRD
ncbi:MAG: metallophosphoesterase [Fusobacteriaceae bacterium]|nr:metallophosphoesterase [Fusobacteriaceae bacterium]